MSRFSNQTPSAQRGDVLIESLIGVLLTAILGAGMAHVAARIAESHYEAKLENLAAEQMRERLHNEGLRLCDQRTIALDIPGVVSPTASITCAEVAQVTVSIAGQSQTIAPPREVLLRAKLVGGPAVEVGTRQLGEGAR
ncbi:hypothetical protein [Pseudoxanthomonas sp. Root630]|uniref:hypothetical protein n=1 Tax=Pseudoxanthomonas sp. Root630 TaxID=1736574 RepID=UPI000AE1A04C|nr:hypothetical protein [Pseudoxanthomonas sp. Root630]